MEKTMEKLVKFSDMVMQDAYRKKKEQISLAEEEKQGMIASSEIRYLQQAYEKIQDAVRKLDREYNEEISKAIVESKESLFHRREEIISEVFSNVRKRLEEFIKSREYREFMEKEMESALREAGKGKTVVTVNENDVDLFREIRSRLMADFEIQESDEDIIGGFLIMNADRGLLWDHTYLSRFNAERASFLERVPLSIE